VAYTAKHVASAVTAAITTRARTHCRRLLSGFLSLALKSSTALASVYWSGGTVDLKMHTGRCELRGKVTAPALQLQRCTTVSHIAHNAVVHNLLQPAATGFAQRARWLRCFISRLMDANWQTRFETVDDLHLVGENSGQIAETQSSNSLDMLT